MIGLVIGIVIGLVVLIGVIKIMTSSSNDSGIISRANKMGRGACAKLKDKLFGC